MKALLCTSAVMLTLVLSLPAHGAERPSVDSLRRVTTVLREGQSRTEVDLADRLIARGTTDVAAIFEHYRMDVLHDAAAADLEQEIALSELQHRALVLALKRVPQSWHNLFHELSRSETERPARRAAVRLIGEIGEAGDIALLLSLARPASESPKASTPADQPADADRAALEDAYALDFERDVERLLVRDVAGFAELEAQFFTADARLQPALARAITNTNSLGGLEVLSQLLGRRAELDVILLTGISKIAAGHAPPFQPGIGDAVRSILGASAEDLIREAALAAGKLEDADSIPMLVTLLSHANRGVRQNAHWSLKKITGLSFAADAKAWGPWLKVEQAWWREGAPMLFAKLETAARPEALQIVQEIARRRYPRHPLAAELSRALSHEDPEVRRLTCAALAQFRSRTALSGLLACLDDSNRDVRSEAGRALQAVTGEDLPPVRAEWTRAGY